jgi:hypothetical protein
MSISKNIISLEELKQTLHYNPSTGEFTWLVRPSQATKIGHIAGSIASDGYIRIGIKGSRYSASNLAWLYMTGTWPLDDIDHQNTVRNDNRWENLREATKAQNQHNKTLNSNTTTGIKGITLKAPVGRAPYYTAHVKINKKTYTKSLALVRGRDAQEVLEELTTWLYHTRVLHHKEFTNHGTNQT